MLVLNSLNEEGAVFEVSTNKVTFIERNGKQQSFALKAKTEVARDLVDVLMHSINKNK
jgi:phosphopantothenoylcysteine decarboxylase/phosphopantothenate--cysteine ligase